MLGLLFTHAFVVWQTVTPTLPSWAFRYGKSNLHHQIQLEAAGQEAKVNNLLEWGADPNAIYGPTQMSPLHMAASWRKPEVVIALLKYKADASRVDVNGLAPLHCAAIYGDLLSVRSLVELGHADVNQRVSTPHGDMTPLDCVLECEEEEDLVLELWLYLSSKGADAAAPQEFIMYPDPYPPMCVSRLTGVLATATRNRWQTRVSSDKKFVTVYVAGFEDADALRKIAVMLKASKSRILQLVQVETGVLLFI